MEPELGPFSFYMECFRELETCRSRVAVAPIPFTAIIEFAKIYEIDDIDEFVYLMRRLDDVYLDHGSTDGKQHKTNDNN